MTSYVATETTPAKNPNESNHMWHGCVYTHKWTTFTSHSMLNHVSKYVN